MALDWPAARERMRSPLYAALAPALARMPSDRWPTRDDLNAAASGVSTSRGMALRFVNPRGHTDRERRHYELRIAAAGEVETRPESWHDLFNALAWITYPQAKAKINAQHAAILEERGAEEAKRRSPARDALTLFDEGGVIVASSEIGLLRLVKDLEWKELFWHRRTELAARVRFFAFGHGLFEQALAPHLGMVAKTVFIAADEGFLALSPQAQVARADTFVAAHFSERANFASPKGMAPMPVLGVPGWHPDTAGETYYDDAEHFRSKGVR